MRINCSTVKSQSHSVNAAIRRATDLAQAMDARCYDGSEGRSRMNPLKYSGIDYVSYVIVLMYLGGMIVYRCAM